MRAPHRSRRGILSGRTVKRLEDPLTIVDFQLKFEAIHKKLQAVDDIDSVTSAIYDQKAKFYDLFKGMKEETARLHDKNIGLIKDLDLGGNETA